MKIVIIGGGTSGWMTAGYVGKLYGWDNVTVIETDKIPRIGVGESVTPHVTAFFTKIGVPTHVWMKETGAVYKYGNKFVNWKTNEGETEYFSFNYTIPANNLYKDISQATSVYDFVHEFTNERNIEYLSKMHKDGLADRFDKFFNPQFHYMEKNVSPFLKNDYLLNGPYSFAQHINAELAAEYIKKNIAIPNGVKNINSKVIKIENQGDDIKKLHLEDGSIITGDLFIDCSGFHKVLINHLGWEEKTYENHKIDSAWVCQTEYQDQKNEMVNYTQSIAEPYGWRFKIGLYHRMGNGYCFSSNHISNEDALEYFEQQIGKQRNRPKLINWQPKRLEKFASGNVIAIGLSCGFVEPLEANSLYIIIASIQMLENLDFAEYNNRMAYTIDDIADFLLLHYTLSSREDTEFWKEMKDIGIKENHKLILKEKINNPKNSMASALMHYTLFPDYMWAQLAASWGHEVINDLDINNDTYKLAKMHFEYFEKKHDYISSLMENNYEWHKKNVFDDLDSKTWESLYNKNKV